MNTEVGSNMKYENKDVQEQNHKEQYDSKNESYARPKVLLPQQYKPKGYGFVMSIIIAVLYCYFAPYLLRYLWPEKVENSRLMIFSCNIIVHEVVYFGYNGFYCFLYYNEIPFFDKYKVQNIVWPWKSNPEAFKKQLWRSAYVLGTNKFIIAPLLFYIGDHKMKTDPTEFPSYFEIMWQTLFFMWIENFMFYWGHRALHTGWLYKNIHKVHHEYTNTVSWCSEHAHPVEYIFGNVLPFALGPALLGSKCHLLTSIFWLSVRIIRTTEAHSGYDFSWTPLQGLPFKLPGDYHNYHHTAYHGNYSSFFIFWDWLCNTTNPNYNKFTKRQENDKDEKTE
jgi:sterol desaturase/sphingolipid hydroxylase (fatty acid hydroxylase superfamily)